MAALLKIYQKSFDNRPVFTLICANATLNAMGDAAAQTAQITPEYPHLPTTPFVPRGLLFSEPQWKRGPVIGKWMKFLERRFPLRSVIGKPSLSAIVKSVASDQLVMAPLGLVAFLGFMGIMEGRTSHEIKKKYTALYTPALLANWSVWPVIQLVNFRFMPMAYRVPFQSTCGVVWTLYLSLLNSSTNEVIHTNQEKYSRSSESTHRGSRKIVN